jgi:assimilatory nitrate reductase catalytic subunit
MPKPTFVRWPQMDDTFVTATDSRPEILVRTGSAVRTTCPYCGVGCGVLVEHSAKEGLQLRGDPDHPANFGRLCSKGTRLLETIGTEERLLQPSIHGRDTSWHEALDHVANSLARIRDEHGPDAIAFYVSGQLLTEDYYVANKLMKGFIGSANIDTNSRLCMSSAVAAHKRAFGEDIVANCYADIELADLVILVGSNFAWCHPVLYQRLMAAKAEHGTHIIVIDPRRTATCEDADLHLPIQPGTDAWLWNGLLAHLSGQGLIPAGAAEHLGLVDAVDLAKQDTPDSLRTAMRCGLAEQQVQDFFTRFANTSKVLTIFSQGINQSSSGVDKGNAIINCHLATNRLGTAGAGAFSITGQPNAMGGREVGGLANTLAAHMDFDQADRVGRFWNAPDIARRPGLKAVDMFEAVRNGSIKAVWVMATNPAASMPDANSVREALARCPLVIVSDCVARTDTLDFAHVRLPASGWGEKDGTVTNSERRISRQRAFLANAGSARADWWIMTEVARRMGFAQAFPFQSAAEVFMEYAALTNFENDGSRALDLAGLLRGGVNSYHGLEPVQWPIPHDPDGGYPRQGNIAKPVGTPRMLGDGRFYHADRRARLIPITPRGPANPLVAGDLALLTGRIRDHWHTLTRTGRSPTLSQHIDESVLTIHPDNARQLCIQDGDLADITSAWGTAIARVAISEEVRKGNVFLPMHWSKTTSLSGAVDGVVNPAVDPISGQPEFKHTPVRITRSAIDWHGVFMGHDELPHVTALMHATRARGQDGYRWKLAGRGSPQTFREAVNKLLGPEVNNARYADEHTGHQAWLWYAQSRVIALAFIGPSSGSLPSAPELTTLMGSRIETGRAHRLLAGVQSDPGADAGPIVCSCFGVGRRTLMHAIEEGLAKDVGELGHQTRAGTNCGSCRPELKKLLRSLQTTSDR